MLGKLMKYELRATSRTMLPLLLLTLLLSVFTRMTSAVVQSGHSKFITVINTLLILAFFLALIGTAVFSVVLMVVRFRNNLMTDEGYLMFTLPVSVHQLLWSKLLVSMLWFIAVFCVDALALVLTVYEDGMFAGLPEFVRTLFDSVNREYMVNGALYMLELLGVLLVSMVTACLMFYAPIAIGNSFATHKTLLSVVFYFTSRPFCRSSRSSAFRLPWSLSRRCSPPRFWTAPSRRRICSLPASLSTSSSSAPFCMS